MTFDCLVVFINVQLLTTANQFIPRKKKAPHDPKRKVHDQLGQIIVGKLKDADTFNSEKN